LRRRTRCAATFRESATNVGKPLILVVFPEGCINPNHRAFWNIWNVGAGLAVLVPFIVQITDKRFGAFVCWRTASRFVRLQIFDRIVLPAGCIGIFQPHKLDRVDVWFIAGLGVIIRIIATRDCMPDVPGRDGNVFSVVGEARHSFTMIIRQSKCVHEVVNFFSRLEFAISFRIIQGRTVTVEEF